MCKENYNRYKTVTSSLVQYTVSLAEDDDVSFDL